MFMTMSIRIGKMIMSMFMRNHMGMCCSIVCVHYRMHMFMAMMFYHGIENDEHTANYHKDQCHEINPR